MRNPSLLLLIVVFILAPFKLSAAADTVVVRETRIPVLIERQDNELFHLRIEATQSQMLNEVKLDFGKDVNLNEIESVKLYYGGTESVERLTLVCDTDCCDIFCFCIDHIHCFYRNTKHTCPDLICIMFYPARFWEILCEFSLCHTAHLTFLIKQNTSVTGSSCIQCHYIFCHIHFLLISLLLLLVTFFSHAFYLNCSP